MLLEAALDDLHASFSSSSKGDQHRSTTDDDDDDEEEEEEEEEERSWVSSSSLLVFEGIEDDDDEEEEDEAEDEEEEDMETRVFEKQISIDPHSVVPQRLPSFLRRMPSDDDDDGYDDVGHDCNIRGHRVATAAMRLVPCALSERPAVDDVAFDDRLADPGQLLRSMFSTVSSSPPRILSGRLKSLGELSSLSNNTTRIPSTVPSFRRISTRPCDPTSSPTLPSTTLDDPHGVGPTSCHLSTSSGDVSLLHHRKNNNNNNIKTFSIVPSFRRSTTRPAHDPVPSRVSPCPISLADLKRRSHETFSGDLSILNHSQNHNNNKTKILSSIAPSFRRIASIRNPTPASMHASPSTTSSDLQCHVSRTHMKTRVPKNLSDDLSIHHHNTTDTTTNSKKKNYTKTLSINPSFRRIYTASPSSHASPSTVSLDRHISGAHLLPPGAGPTSRNVAHQHRQQQVSNLPVAARLSVLMKCQHRFSLPTRLRAATLVSTSFEKTHNIPILKTRSFHNIANAAPSPFGGLAYNLRTLANSSSSGSLSQKLKQKQNQKKKKKKQLSADFVRRCQKEFLNNRLHPSDDDATSQPVRNSSGSKFTCFGFLGCVKASRSKPKHSNNISAGAATNVQAATKETPSLRLSVFSESSSQKMTGNNNNISGKPPPNMNTISNMAYVQNPTRVLHVGGEGLAEHNLQENCLEHFEYSSQCSVEDNRDLIKRDSADSCGCVELREEAADASYSPTACAFVFHPDIAIPSENAMNSVEAARNNTDSISPRRVRFNLDDPSLDNPDDKRCSMELMMPRSASFDNLDPLFNYVNNSYISHEVEEVEKVHASMPSLSTQELWEPALFAFDV